VLNSPLWVDIVGGATNSVATTATVAGVSPDGTATAASEVASTAVAIPARSPRKLA